MLVRLWEGGHGINEEWEKKERERNKERERERGL